MCCDQCAYGSVDRMATKWHATTAVKCLEVGSGKSARLHLRQAANLTARRWSRMSCAHNSRRMRPIDNHLRRGRGEGSPSLDMLPLAASLASLLVDCHCGPPLFQRCLRCGRILCHGWRSPPSADGVVEAPPCLSEERPFKWCTGPDESASATTGRCFTQLPSDDLLEVSNRPRLSTTPHTVRARKLSSGHRRRRAMLVA